MMILAEVSSGRSDLESSSPTKDEMPTDRTGAAGSVGAEVVAKAPPDGYTLLLGTIGTNAINAALYSKMPYDVNKDFAPIPADHTDLATR